MECPELEPPSCGPSLKRASILFLMRRPDLSATLISLPGRYAHFLKWTRISSSGLSISPDGRWIMYSLVGDVSSDIMLVDHFH